MGFSFEDGGWVKRRRRGPLTHSLSYVAIVAAGIAAAFAGRFVAGPVEFLGVFGIIGGSLMFFLNLRTQILRLDAEGITAHVRGPGMLFTSWPEIHPRFRYSLVLDGRVRPRAVIDPTWGIDTDRLAKVIHARAPQAELH